MEKYKDFQTPLYTSFKWQKKKKNQYTLKFEHTGRYQGAHTTEK